VRATGQELDPGRIVGLAMAQIGLMIRFEGWILALALPGQGALIFEKVCGPGLGGLRRRTVALGDGLIGRAGASRQTLLAGEGGEDGTPDLPRGVRARSALAVPLLCRGRLVGVATLVDRRGRRRFSADEARLATLLLEPAAAALDAALLVRRSEELSVTDDLTRLYNSRYLNAALGREVERSRRYRSPLSVIFLDLDGFKNVNDRHGHMWGSRTLVEVGAVVRETVRAIDVVARFGGDEFTVILPQTDRRGARVIAERLRERIAEARYLKAYGLEVRVTASLGIATYPEDGRTGEDLLACADRAMYRAKEAGKDRVASGAASGAEFGGKAASR
jgi:diguanylate cyclase (GGDEF)-like protein